MKQITFQPSSNLISIPKNEFDDSFADYLSRILTYYQKNYPDCKLTVNFLNSVSASFDSEGNCKSNLDYTLSTGIKKGKITKKENNNKITINWLAEKKEEEEEEPENTTGTDLFNLAFSPIANKIAGSLTGIVSHYTRDESKQIIEDIQRIKELLK